jgi:hypothetical protein
LAGENVKVAGDAPLNCALHVTVTVTGPVGKRDNEMPKDAGGLAGPGGPSDVVSFGFVIVIWNVGVCVCVYVCDVFILSS